MSGTRFEEVPPSSPTVRRRCDMSLTGRHSAGTQEQRTLFVDDFHALCTYCGKNIYRVSRRSSHWFEDGVSTAVAIQQDNSNGDNNE